MLHSGQTTNVRDAVKFYWNRWEGPTWLIIISVYGGWLLLTAFAAHIPWILLTPFGGAMLCLHSSMQHELIHGHPTRSRRINMLLAWPPLSLWLPFAIYRDSHVEHHRSDHLTCPRRDPESFYIPSETWASSGRVRRSLWMCNNTLVGRLLVGPYLLLGGFWRSELRRLINGDHRYLRVWLGHGVGVGAVLAWIILVCDISVWRYWLLCIWPGVALVLLRSFYEHRPAVTQALRTGVVETNILFRLLFLNNNYHALHHERPGVPWFDLHQSYWAQRDTVLAGNGGFVFPGYGYLVRRYSLSPKDLPVQLETDAETMALSTGPVQARAVTA